MLSNAASPPRIPEKGFAPDYGRIVNYRSAAGFGIRLDAGSGDAGSVITPFYDSMLVKLTATARTFEAACRRMDRALREFRIRGVKTNIPFLENIINDSLFLSGDAHTKLIDEKPSLFEFSPRRDRATKLLNYLSDITINGNPGAKNWKPAKPFATPRLVDWTPRPAETKGSRDILLEKGPQGFAEWIKNEKRLLVTDTTMRDAHQSLIATRMRTHDMLAIAEAVSNRTPNLFSLEMWGGATFDTAMRFLKEDPWERLRELRERVPNICFQMLFRGSNAVGYSNYPDNVVAGFVKHAADSGMDIFRIFDSLNYLPNMKVAMEAAAEHGTAVCEAAVCYTGDITNPDRAKYSLKYYVDKAKELGKNGSPHSLYQRYGRPLPPSRRDQTFLYPQARDRYPHPFPHPRHLWSQCLLHHGGIRCRSRHCRHGPRLHVRFHFPAQLKLRLRRHERHRARPQPRHPGSQRVFRLLGRSPHPLRTLLLRSSQRHRRSLSS